jgi:hypothetical protein
MMEAVLALNRAADLDSLTEYGFGTRAVKITFFMIYYRSSLIDKN